MTAVQKPNFLDHWASSTLWSHPLFKDKPRYLKTQIDQWLLQHHEQNLENMSNLPKTLRSEIQQEFCLATPTLIDRQDSGDGSIKLLLKTSLGHIVEAVILVFKERITLCVSSQVGCKMACAFCQTGKLGFFKHLTAGEILSQYLYAQQLLKREGLPSRGPSPRISHVVFMGMGEPLDNYAAAVRSSELLISGFGLSKRRVTISTSGLADRIEKLADENVQASLALSLHAAEDELRSSLMPINRKYPLDVLSKACRYYQKKTGREITIEYLLLDGINDQTTHANALLHWVRGMDVKMNLIAFNDHPGLPFSESRQMFAFQRKIQAAGYDAPIRFSRAKDVSGACGQLAGKVMSQLQEAPSRRTFASIA